MPIYADRLIVPADTQASSPAELTLHIWEQTVTEFAIYFPPGCHGLVQAAVYYGSERIAPKRGESIRGNATLARWPEKWIAPEKPCPIRFAAWSPGTLYPHALLCMIVTQPDKAKELENLQAESQNLLIKFLKLIVGVRR